MCLFKNPVAVLDNLFGLLICVYPRLKSFSISWAFIGG